MYQSVNTYSLFILLDHEYSVKSECRREGANAHLHGMKSNSTTGGDRPNNYMYPQGRRSYCYN